MGQRILMPTIFTILLLPMRSALYFFLKDGGQKCFMVDVPKDTLVVGHYKCEVFSIESEKFVLSSPGLGMHVNIGDKNGKLVLSRVYGSQGMFSFSSHETGEHFVCLHSNISSEWLLHKKLRIHFSLDVGERAIDYQQLSGAERLNQMELRVRQLLEQTKYIAMEQKYQREREESFRQISEITNNRTLYLALPQIVILIIVSVLQIRHLKNFFLAKKLV